MASRRPLPRILHICSATGEPGPTAAWPRRASPDEATAAVLAECFETEACHNVYAALAQLLRPESRSADRVPDALLVCIDEMEAAELEFFSLVSRHLPDVPTLVYGRIDLEGLISQALDRGASGRATADGLQSLADRAGEPASTRDMEEAADAELEASASPSVSPQRSPSPNDVDEWPDPEAAAADEPVPPVRVPWLRYTDAPVRRAPEPRPGVDDSESSASHPLAGDAAAIPQHTPLLTDEELQALMGPSDFDDSNGAEGGLGEDSPRDRAIPREDGAPNDRMEFGQ